MRSSALIGLFVVCLLLAVSCDDGGPEAPGAEVAVAVAPLSLAGVTDADYRITVYNAGSATGEVVWERSGLTSDQYGDGAGSLAYVGPCDAETGTNSVELELTALYEGAGALIAADTYDNPTPIVRDIVCSENTDVAVTFDITLARRAQQGFFDVAVNFDDVFCSAKLDCVRSGTSEPLELLHHPGGGRGLTAVLGFACTADPTAPSADTFLYMDDPTITCANQGEPVTITFDVSGVGNVDLSGATNPGGYLFAAAVYRGNEALANKAYWNVAFGLDETTFGDLGECTLSTEATAASTELPAFPDGFAPPDGNIWPVLTWDVVLSDENGRVCGAHAVGDGSEVAVAYYGYLAAANQFSWSDERTYLDHGYDSANARVYTPGWERCRFETCGPSASCVDLPGFAYECVCDAGLMGDPYDLVNGCTCPSTPSGFGGGSGTEADPYLVCDGAHLARISSYQTSHFRQGADIDLGGTPWTPVWLKGGYDGGGHTIANLVIDQPASTYVGLFSRVDNAVVSGVHVVSGDVLGDSTVGAIAGMAYNSTVTDCSNAARVAGNAGGGSIGGVVGMLYGSAGYRLANHGPVVGSPTVGSAPDIGGVVGRLDSGASLDVALNTGAVTTSFTGSHFHVGGVVSIVGAGTSVTNALNLGTVAGQRRAGGVTAYISNGTLANAVNLAPDVTIVPETIYPNSLGGVVSYIAGSTTVEHLYSVALDPDPTSAPYVTTIGDDLAVTDWAPILVAPAFDLGVWALDGGGQPYLVHFGPN